MKNLSPSVLVADQGQRILLRLAGRFHDLSHVELCSLLGVPQCPPGLGVTIDREQLHFEFAGSGQAVEITASQLHRRLAKQTSKA